MTPKQWRTAREPQEMLKLLENSGRPSPRKLRLFGCACVRRVAHLLVDRATVSALELAERAADGQAASKQFTAMRQRLNAEVKGGGTSSYLAAARRSALAAGLLAPSALVFARARTWAWSAARELMRVDAGRAAAEVAVSAECAAANGGLTRWDQAVLERHRSSERGAQAELLRDIFGDRRRPFTPSPSCLTPAALALASAAYTERALPSGHLQTARLAILADALEEAGCADTELLGHLRSDGPHVRGCAALDAVLGRS